MHDFMNCLKKSVYEVDLSEQRMYIHLYKQLSDNQKHLISKWLAESLNRKNDKGHLHADLNRNMAELLSRNDNETSLEIYPAN